MEYLNPLKKAYRDYSAAYDLDNSVGVALLDLMPDGTRVYHKPVFEMFADIVNNDAEFAAKWNIAVEKRDMTWEERVKWVMKNTDVEWENLHITEEVHKSTTPTKVTVFTYKGQSGFKYE
jgi:hypothetical protein